MSKEDFYLPPELQEKVNKNATDFNFFKASPIKTIAL